MLLNNELIQKINLIENITKAKIKEFIEKEDKIIIVVGHNELSRALGVKGKNIKTIENLMHRRLKIIQFYDDPLKFVRNFIYPIKPLSLTLNNNIIEIKVDDRKSKGLLIGRESKNLKELNNLVAKYYKLEVKVL